MQQHTTCLNALPDQMPLPGIPEDRSMTGRIACHYKALLCFLSVFGEQDPVRVAELDSLRIAAYQQGYADALDDVQVPF